MILIAIKLGTSEPLASNSMQEYAKGDSEYKTQALTNTQTKLVSTKLTINISL